MRRFVRFAAAAALAVAVGCSNGASGAIAVELNEHDIVASPGTADAGEVTFDLENSGEETHEFVVVKTDLAADDLPTADDGSFVEDDLEVVDEIEDLATGASQSLTLDLEAGRYLLACNIVEEEENGELESHFELGMHSTFTVS